MQYIGNAVTDKGSYKKVNQDSLTVKIADSPWGPVCLAVICDGLGGLKQGEVASTGVVTAFDRWFRERFGRLQDGWCGKEIEQEWRKLLLFANDRIMEYGKRNRVELGTTVTAALFCDTRYYVMHVGDCRLYAVTDRLTQLTKDQTLIAYEMEAGRMTAEQAASDSRKNVLLQCVGVTGHIVPDFLTGSVSPDTAYLLCSDGFRHEITDQEIEEWCNPRKNENQEAIGQNLKALVALNRTRGERDNISAILIRAGKQVC